MFTNETADERKPSIEHF